MFQALGQAIKDRLKQHGVAEAVEAAQVTELLRSLVAEKWGPSAGASLRKVALRGNTLEVLADSGTLAAELRMHEYDLQDALKAKSNGKVYRLRIFG